jgi:hypothetical protein
MMSEALDCRASLAMTSQIRNVSRARNEDSNSRHCEEQSDAAISVRYLTGYGGLAMTTVFHHLGWFNCHDR